MSGNESYQQLEVRIRKNDVESLLARWHCGCLLLGEQGDGKVSRGRIEELSNALELSPAELYNRRQFAKQFPTEEQVRDAFQHWGSWFMICQRGLGRRQVRKGRMQKERGETWGSGLPLSVAEQAYHRLRREMRRFLRERGVDFAMTDVMLVGVRTRYALTDVGQLDAGHVEQLTRDFVELRVYADRCIQALRRKLDGWQVTWGNPGPTLLDRVAESENKTVTLERKVPRAKNRRLVPSTVMV